MTNFDCRPVLIGSGGRVGRALARVWTDAGAPFTALSHQAGADAVMTLGAPPPDLPQARGEGVVVLAGAVPGGALPLSANAEWARAGIAAARAWGAARVFVVSSSAVYGPTGAAPVTEDAPTSGTSAYARAKIAAEAEAQSDGATVLRVANVAGLSEPFLSLSSAARPVLDRFADGRGPSRSYVGIQTLARVLRALCGMAARGRSLPGVLNVAAPPPVAMADIFAAYGVAHGWRDAPAGAVQHVHLDVTRLGALVELPRSDAAMLRAEAEAIR